MAINTKMRTYNYQTFGDLNDYGQPALSDVVGTVKMAIHLSTEVIDENSLYSGAQYVGLTHAAIDATYVIQYGEEKLKVLHVNPEGRMKQVFLARM